MRPGVPTTMSAPARMRCTCAKRLTPPRIATSAQPGFAAEAVQAVLDLQGKLAGGGEDQRPCGKALRRGLLGGEVLQQGQRESGGLAGAGLRDAKQIAAGQQMRDGGGLDGGGMEEALPVKRAQQGLG